MKTRLALLASLVAIAGGCLVPADAFALRYDNQPAVGHCYGKKTTMNARAKAKLCGLYKVSGRM